MLSFYFIMIIFFILLILLFILYRLIRSIHIEKYKQNTNNKESGLYVINSDIKENVKKNMRILNHFHQEKLENYDNFPPIYCLMVTGKDEQRIRYAVSSIRNFIHQDYKNKYLIIINHHPHISVLDAFAYEQDIERLKLDDLVSEKIVEIYIEKNEFLTLGMLRNISLQLVPMFALWITWDDDDWRSNDFLTLLYNVYYENEVDAVAFTKRFEFNENTNFSWMIELKSGLPFVLSKKNPLIEYANVDTMEDINLINNMENVGLKVAIFENDPRIYIRLIHNNNTSEYANATKSYVQKINAKLKSEANYIESEINSEQKKYINKKLNDLLATKRK